jgi:hypothetical protein
MGYSFEKYCFDLNVNFGGVPGNYPGHVFLPGFASAVQVAVDPHNAVLGDVTQNIDYYGVQMAVGWQTTYASHESEISAAVQAPMNPPSALPFPTPEEGDGAGYVAAKSASPLPTDLQCVSGN